MSGFFTWSQLKELELQALIYKHMLAGVPVPSELVLSIKRSLLSEAAARRYHHCQQTNELPVLECTRLCNRRYEVEVEPKRCRRTDGKKWRCSREAAAGHKYCEHHLHRERNRSRKRVETSPIDVQKDQDSFQTETSEDQKCGFQVLRHSSYESLEDLRVSSYKSTAAPTMNPSNWSGATELKSYPANEKEYISQNLIQAAPLTDWFGWASHVDGYLP